MTLSQRLFSRDHSALLDQLSQRRRLLIIQDLDGVCMGLVSDPLTRQIERRYLDAARDLKGQFYVLTNGEHTGRRGVNSLVDRALHQPDLAAAEGYYLPGLAAGGVQLQNRYGQVSHPGVSDAELEFLLTVPERLTTFLRKRLSADGLPFSREKIEALLQVGVLDNPVSPTVNLNGCYLSLREQPARYRELQQALAAFLIELEREATRQGLSDAYFVHYAPNLGREADGRERLRPGDENQAGTTDFQFMVKGAVKEVGVLVLLNHYYAEHYGHYPLGPDFNARQAPREPDVLLRLACDHFDADRMPCIVGVGDTVSSIARSKGGQTQMLRGGSDRGFLTLVQDLGRAFGTDNAVLYVDSSGGEVRRPGVDADRLDRCAFDPTLSPWPALQDISDPDDPLRLNFIFAGGHPEYVDFFTDLARRRDALAREAQTLSGNVNSYSMPAPRP